MLSKSKVLSKYLINDKNKGMNESRLEQISMGFMPYTFYCVCLIILIINLPCSTRYLIPLYSTNISAPWTTLPFTCFVISFITLLFIYLFNVSASCIRYRATYRATKKYFKKHFKVFLFLIIVKYT